MPKVSVLLIVYRIIIKKPQKKEFSTFEPNTDVKDVYKPDLLMIERYGSPST